MYLKFNKFCILLSSYLVFNSCFAEGDSKYVKSSISYKRLSLQIFNKRILKTDQNKVDTTTMKGEFTLTDNDLGSRMKVVSLKASSPIPIDDIYKLPIIGVLKKIGRNKWGIQNKAFSSLFVYFNDLLPFILFANSHQPVIFKEQGQGELITEKLKIESSLKFKGGIHDVLGKYSGAANQIDWLIKNDIYIYYGQYLICSEQHHNLINYLELADSKEIVIDDFYKKLNLKDNDLAVIELYIIPIKISKATLDFNNKKFAIKQVDSKGDENPKVSDVIIEDKETAPEERRIEDILKAKNVKIEEVKLDGTLSEDIPQVNKKNDDNAP